MPDLIGDGSPTVGFLDIPDLDLPGVVGAILDGFSHLDGDAVLTVYCGLVDLQAITASCDEHDIELVHTVRHGTGRSLVLRRRAPRRPPESSGAELGTAQRDQNAAIT